eukprot:366372-Chlamydomonas_euryale.AAC.15
MPRHYAARDALAGTHESRCSATRPLPARSRRLRAARRRVARRQPTFGTHAAYNPNRQRPRHSLIATNADARARAHSAAAAAAAAPRFGAGSCAARGGGGGHGRQPGGGAAFGQMPGERPACACRQSRDPRAPVLKPHDKEGPDESLHPPTRLVFDKSTICRAMHRKEPTGSHA